MYSTSLILTSCALAITLGVLNRTYRNSRGTLKILVTLVSFINAMYLILVGLHYSELWIAGFTRLEKTPSLTTGFRIALVLLPLLPILIAFYSIAFTNVMGNLFGFFRKRTEILSGILLVYAALSINFSDHSSEDLVKPLFNLENRIQQSVEKFQGLQDEKQTLGKQLIDYQSCVDTRLEPFADELSLLVETNMKEESILLKNEIRDFLIEIKYPGVFGAEISDARNKYYERLRFKLDSDFERKWDMFWADRSFAKERARRICAIERGWVNPPPDSATWVMQKDFIPEYIMVEHYLGWILDAGK